MDFININAWLLKLMSYDIDFFCVDKYYIAIIFASILFCSFQGAFQDAVRHLQNYAIGSKTKLQVFKLV